MIVSLLYFGFKHLFNYKKYLKLILINRVRFDYNIVNNFLPLLLNHKECGH